MPVFLKNVKGDMLKLPRDPKEYPNLTVQRFEVTTSPGIKSITYKAIVLGESDNYSTYVQFFKLSFQESKDSKHPVESKVGRSKIYHNRPSISTNPVFLKCSCPDFRFVWEKPLYDNKGLIGRWRKYTKVPGSTRAPRNPENYIGYCKHVNSLLFRLRNSGIITD